MVTNKTLRTDKGKQVCFENDFKFANPVDLNKCLKQTKLPILLYTCAHISELPSNISTMSEGNTPVRFGLSPI